MIKDGQKKRRTVGLFKIRLLDEAVNFESPNGKIEEPPVVALDRVETMIDLIKEDLLFNSLSVRVVEGGPLMFMLITRADFVKWFGFINENSEYTRNYGDLPRVTREMIKFDLRRWRDKPDSS